MANGNIFKEIKEVLKTNPNSLTIEARDRLVLEGIIGLHDRIDGLPKVDLDGMEKLKKHEVTLYGNEFVKGHDDRIQALENKMSLILWIIGGVVTPILVAIGVGVVRILQIGV